MTITRTDQLYLQNEHSAIIAHGAHPEYRLEFPAEVDDTDSNFTKIYQGSVVSLNADGKYICGCGVGSGANYPVPCISLKNVFDPDVTTGKLGTTAFVTGSSYTVLPDYRKSTYSAVGGKITAIPCTGGYEIETTEFDFEDEYAPNDALIPGTGDNLGKIVKSSGAIGAAPVVGFVSRAMFSVDSYQQKRISFWTNFIPATH
jgi:hypothetical protein